MRKYCLIFLVVFCGRHGRRTPFVCAGALEPLFPGQFGRWKAISAPIKIKSDEGRAQVLAESGMTDSLANEYSDGAQKVAVHTQAFRDPAARTKRTPAEFGPGMHPSTVGGPSAIDQERLLLLPRQPDSGSPAPAESNDR